MVVDDLVARGVKYFDTFPLSIDDIPFFGSVEGSSSLGTESPAALAARSLPVMMVVAPDNCPPGFNGSIVCELSRRSIYLSRVRVDLDMPEPAG